LSHINKVNNALFFSTMLPSSSAYYVSDCFVDPIKTVAIEEVTAAKVFRYGKYPEY
jgi:hypothetical protein